MQVQVKALQEGEIVPEQFAAAIAGGGGVTDTSGGTVVTDSPCSSSAASQYSPSSENRNPPLTAMEMMMAQSPTGSRDSNSPQAIRGAPVQRWPAAAAAVAETDASFASREPLRTPPVVQENCDERAMMYGNSVAATAGAGRGGGAGGSASAAPARFERSLRNPSHLTATSVLTPDPADRSANATGVSSGVAWQGTLSEPQAAGHPAVAPEGGPAPELEVLGGEAGQRLDDMHFEGTDLMEVAAVLLSEEDD